MRQNRIRDLVNQLDLMSKKHPVGYKNDDAIREMTPVFYSLAYECGSNAYLREKLASARHDFDVMFSARKHLKYGSSEEVANRFRSHLGLIVKWIESFIPEDDITPESEP